MKFRVEKSEFLKQLSNVSNIVPAKPVVTIISNLMIEAEKNKLSFSSTDFEITMHTEMPASVSEEGVIIVNAKTLVDLVKRLPEGDIDITSHETEITIKTSSGVYKMPFIKKDDYVDIQNIDKSKLFDVESMPIINAIENTVFAVSKDTVKYATTGVLVEGSGKSITFVATDGYRLSLYSIKDILEENVSVSIIVPPKALNILRGLIDDVENFKMGFDDKRIMFKVNETEISAKLIEGNYPDYKRVIPSDNNRVMTVGKDLFVDALNRVSIFTNPNTRLVKMEIADKKMTINAYQSQTGEGTEYLDVDYNDKEKLVIGFNHSFLSEMLRKVETSNVKFKLKGEMNTVIIENEESKVGEEVLFIIMPLRLK